MKICFVTTGDIKNIATSKRAFGMSTPLSKLGWEVNIVIEDTEENRKRAKMECEDSVRLHFFKKSNPLVEISEKNKLIKRIKPDVIYICAFVIRNIVRGYGATKLVEHSELQSAIPDLSTNKKVLAKALEWFSTHYGDGLLCASKYLLNHFKRLTENRFNENLLMYFPYAYSAELYNIVPDSKLPSKFLRLKNKKNFIYLGTVTNNYGAKLMLEAFRRLKHKNIDARLILLGRGRHYQEALNFVESNQLKDIILLPGYVAEEDIEKYFSIADAFVSPMQDTIQDWARCPSKLYMYLPFKKPIFTCKIGEPLEVLGQNAFYYEPESSLSLSETIANYLLDHKRFNSIKPEVHSWQLRSEEFHTWISQILK